MTYDAEILTLEQRDFLAEMMNIGAGNAATALSQVMRCNIDVRIPKVVVARPSTLVDLITNEPSFAATCIRMDMCGQVRGELYYIVPNLSLIHI